MIIIACREGFFRRGALPARCHNPGALVYVGQAHARRGPRGFACFAADSEGWEALQNDLLAKIQDGRSLHKAWRYLHD